MEIFGIPLQAMMSQLLLGLVNGSFYAMLSLGLAVIFGLLNVINFAHGALYMMGAFFAWMGLTYFGINYWVMLVVAPLLVGLFGIIVEKTPARLVVQTATVSGTTSHFRSSLTQFGQAIFGATMTSRRLPVALKCRLATPMAWMVL